MAEERRGLLRAQRRKVELANAERAGRLVDAKAVQIRYATKVLVVRDRLLSLPSRLKLHLPHLTDADLSEIDAILRQDLVELAARPAPAES